MTTTQLIEKARNGNNAAKEEVCTLLRDRVLSAAGHYASLTGMDREDLQQEMWTGILLGLGQVDVSIGDPMAYLFLRGKWRLLEAIRISERERVITLEEVTISVRTAFEDEVLVSLFVHQLSARLRGLQPTILRGLLDGYRQEEVAQEMGYTGENISYHVKKIREHMRDLQNAA